jgi:hypothetical protein
MISQIFSGLFGLAVAVSVFLFVLKRNAMRWTALAEEFGPPQDDPLVKRKFMDVIVHAQSGIFNSYKGITTFGVHPDGVSFSLWGPFAIFHEPFFVPFQRMKVSGRDWYVNAASVNIDVGSPEGFELITDRKAIEWVAKTPGVEWPRGQEILSGILAMEPKTHDRMTTVRLIYIVITLHMLVGVGYIAWKEFGFMLPELP